MVDFPQEKSGPTKAVQLLTTTMYNNILTEVSAKNYFKQPVAKNKRSAKLSITFLYLI